jgi:hypothetical protein
MEDLFEKILDVIGSLKDEFTTHELILKLAHQHQREYIKALYEHRNLERPFGTLHSRIGKHLSSMNSVQFVGDEADMDIFGHKSENALWRKKP